MDNLQNVVVGLAELAGRAVLRHSLHQPFGGIAQDNIYQSTSKLHLVSVGIPQGSLVYIKSRLRSGNRKTFRKCYLLLGAYKLNGPAIKAIVCNFRY